MKIFLAVVIGLMIEMICQVKETRKPAQIGGLFSIIVGGTLILLNNINGWYYLMTGIGVYLLLGRGEKFSIRNEFMKYLPVFYITAFVCMAIGHFFISWLLVLGIVILIGTALGQILCWLFSPIVFRAKIEKDKE